MKRLVRFLEILFASIAFAGALISNYYSGQYVKAVGSKSPSLHSDLLLLILPRVDLTLLFVWGFAAFLVYAILAAIFTQSHRIPYFMWMYALLISLRSFFILLTPMGAPPGMFHIQDSFFQTFANHLTFDNDLFFSAHTSMPFLAFLIFHRYRVRLIFMAFSVILASCVLLARFHYSIDVVGAYFITFALVRLHQEKIEPLYQSFIAKILRRKETSLHG